MSSEELLKQFRNDSQYWWLQCRLSYEYPRELPCQMIHALKTNKTPKTRFKLDAKLRKLMNLR